MSLLAVALALGVASSLAGENVRLEVEGQLPCTEAELADAVALRVGVSTAAVERVLIRAVETGVEVEYLGQVRRVDLAASALGHGAARRIALAISDLVRGPITVGLPPLDPPPPPPVTATVASPPPPPPFVSMEEPRPPAFLIGPFFRGGTGDSLNARFVFGADVSLALAGPLRAVIAPSVAILPPRSRDGFDIDYLAFLGAAGLGLRFPEQSWELRALGVAEIYFVRGSEGIDGTVGVLPAVELAFLYGIGLGAGFELELGLSASAYLARKQFNVNQREILRTDRAAGALSIGVAWGADP